MIPSSEINRNISIINEPKVSKTYRLSNNKIQGFTDGLQALEQAIYKELNTERYEYPIYSFSYGIELESLIGKDPTYVKLELKRRIQECLLQDDRIKSVDNFNFDIAGDELLCTFEVKSIYGDLSISQEVGI